ncbi:hypothetical protein ACX80I_12655 [Arthrobacter sp. MDT3-44]
MEPLTVAEVVGANLKEMRAQYDITLAELSRWLRFALGLNWSTGRLADVESGRGSATVQVVLALSLAISDISGEEVPPGHFLITDKPVVLGPTMTLVGPVLREVFDGEKLSLEIDDLHRGRERESEIVNRAHRGLLPPADQWSLTDERAAKKLGISRDQLTQRSLRLWGVLLSEEVRRQANPDDSPQKKGRLTRVLMEQLQGVSDGDD